MTLITSVGSQKITMLKFSRHPGTWLAGQPNTDHDADSHFFIQVNKKLYYVQVSKERKKKKINKVSVKDQGTRELHKVQVR